MCPLEFALYSLLGHVMPDTTDHTGGIATVHPRAHPAAPLADDRQSVSVPFPTSGASMTTGDSPVDPLLGREPAGSRGCPDLRRLRPTAALAEMIGKVLAGPPLESAAAANEAHRLGEAAASALLDAGDLRAWELTTRVAAEITALARVGWIPAERY